MKRKKRDREGKSIGAYSSPEGNYLQVHIYTRIRTLVLNEIFRKIKHVDQGFCIAFIGIYSRKIQYYPLKVNVLKMTESN